MDTHRHRLSEVTARSIETTWSVSSGHSLDTGSEVTVQRIETTLMHNLDTHRHRDRGHCKQLKQHGASMDTHRHRDSGSLQTIGNNMEHHHG